MIASSATISAETASTIIARTTATTAVTTSAMTATTGAIAARIFAATVTIETDRVAENIAIATTGGRMAT